MQLTEANIKYIGVKLKKGLKKPELAAAGIIKDADGLCARLLLFLLCFKVKELEKIDAALLRASIGDDVGDDSVLDALDYLKARGVLDYKYERADDTECKGANMDKIVSIIGSISDNINGMNGGEHKEPEATLEQLEFENIYRLGKGRKAMVAPKEVILVAEPEELLIEGAREPVRFEKIGLGEPGERAKGSEESVVIVCEALENEPDFRKFYFDVQDRLKLIINPDDLEIIYNLFNKMETELLLELARYCGENSSNPANAIRLYEKTALGLCNDGILTVQEYNENIESKRQAAEYEAKIRNMFGLGDKKLTAKDRGLIRTWALEYKFSDEMILHGFTLALDKGKASIPYINAIYLSWHQKGFTNVEQVRREFGDGGGNAIAKKPDPEFDSDKFFEKLVRQSLES